MNIRNEFIILSLSILISSLILAYAYNYQSNDYNEIEEYKLHDKDIYIFC